MISGEQQKKACFLLNVSYNPTLRRVFCYIKGLVNYLVPVFSGLVG